MGCEICGKELGRNASRFCGHACRSVWYSGKKAAERTRPCVVCGKPFSARGGRKTCSSECRYNLLRKTFADRGIQPAPMTDEMKAAASERMKGPGCPKWNGGKTTCGNGRYILAKAPADYPFPQSVDRRGYIREHRMVMELALGRPLARYEVVHHRNGDARDNRTENLELIADQSEHLIGHWKEGTFANRHR